MPGPAFESMSLGTSSIKGNSLLPPPPSRRNPVYTSTSVCIGIGGGVGPAAGVILHKKIVENTVSDGTDQSHCEVHHISRPDVADRTAFLLGKGQVSPAVGMAKTMAALKDSVRRAGKRFVVAGVPCNTFHAPRIWDEFLGKLDAEGTARTVKMVHMLEETVGAIKAMLPGARKIGLLSTTGTRTSRVYHDLLEPQGLEVVQVDEAEQAGVHDAIYNTEWGVKAVQPTTLTAQAQFQAYAADLVAKGAEAIILGCTEIPLALPMAAFEGVPLVDPMVALARACIQKAGALVTELTLYPADFSPCSVPASLVEGMGGLSVGHSPSTPLVVGSVGGPLRDSAFMLAAGRGPMLASSAPVGPLHRRAKKSGRNSTGNRRAPVWQQHAAACVIQLAYRAHNQRRAGSPSQGQASSLDQQSGSRFGVVYSQSMPDLFEVGSPTSSGVTPEIFSRPTQHVDPQPSDADVKLQLQAAEELGEELMT